MSPSDHGRRRPPGGQEYDPVTGVTDQRLGTALRKRRLEATLEATAAAAGADIGLEDLLAFESGSRRPDPLAVIRLLGQYRNRQALAG